MLTAEFAKTLTEYQTASGPGFDLSDAMRGVTSLDAALKRFDAEIASGSVPSEIANCVRRDLARILVPLNYIRTSRFRHDPAITRPPLPTLDVVLSLEEQDVSLRGFALTQGMRAQNHIVAELRAARKLIDAALGSRHI